MEIQKFEAASEVVEMGVGFIYRDYINSGMQSSKMKRTEIEKRTAAKNWYITISH